MPGVDATMLDAGDIAAFRSRWQRKSNFADISRWSAAELLENAELTVDGKPTYASLLLLGTAKALSRHLVQAEAVFEYRSSEASIAYQQRQEFRLGFFLWFDDIWKLVNLRNDVQQFREGLFKYDIAASKLLSAWLAEAVIGGRSWDTWQIFVGPPLRQSRVSLGCRHSSRKPFSRICSRAS